LNSEFLQEFIDATKNQSKDKGMNFDFDYDLDEFVTCAPAFEKLKMLMKFWLKDIIQAQSTQADDLISNFYRWLTSTTSKLYDPLLHRLVHKMMKKHLQTLVLEFK
jgi:DNA polymerase epsilon subunit 1